MDELIDIDVISDELITVEVLLDGGSSQIIALPYKYRFGSLSARDAYFAANPNELTARLWVLVGDMLYQYLNNTWTSMSTVITGPAGEPFKVVATVATVDDLPDPEFANSNEAYLVTFDDGNHLYVLVGDKWEDQGVFSGVPGPKGDTGPKGDPGEAPTFRINEDGHLIAIYKGDINGV